MRHFIASKAVPSTVNTSLLTRSDDVILVLKTNPPAPEVLARPGQLFKAANDLSEHMERMETVRELSVRVRRTFPGGGIGLNSGGISRLDSDEQLVPFVVLARFCRASTGKGLIEQLNI